MAASLLPSRHDRVWLRGSWPGALLSPPDPALLADVRGWLGRGLPAVACRVAAGLPEGAVALGIALRVGPEVRRAAFAVAGEVVASFLPPLSLAEARESAPPAWRTGLGELEAAASALGLPLGVYGSLAWQHLSGEPYLQPGSDVDLLLAPRTRKELEEGLRLLERAGRAGPRLDGEVLLGGGRAASWRELLGSPRRVLVKSLRSVALLERGEALGPLAAGEAA
ncbi:MAG TPA: malonate decarboxylase holo-[acyl-carrier-protein] synthase [Anaeromyxobacteraceae bacterium]|nr:malonate decarboxylase holo-[acyl-carrier-protein] synthase [Anaeromyxobacteraceae bacterium]